MRHSYNSKNNILWTIFRNAEPYTELRGDTIIQVPHHPIEGEPVQRT